jgi:type 1 glutamine amidotransferase
MKPRLVVLLSLFAGVVSLALAADTTPAAAAKPLRALLITGGCCHDYDFQAKMLTEGLKPYGPITWTIVNEGGKTTKGQIKLYEDPQWAKPYDVVVHNECFADTNDPAYVAKIVAAHRAGTPAVVIHCAMHTYRSAKIDDWREFLGVTSRHHEHQSHDPVAVLDKDNPITQAIPADYKTPMDELYIVEKVWPNTKILATTKSEKTGDVQPVFWTNQFGKARVFGTTYGHSNDTFSDKVFLTTLVRGIAWAASRDVKTGEPK